MAKVHDLSLLETARKRTLYLVLAADLLLITFTIANGYPAIWSEFDREFNLWTFGSSAQSVLVAVAAYINYLLMWSRQAKSAWVWIFMTVVFTFFALDDMLILHERAGHQVENTIPFLSRESIVIYMDDILVLAYCGAAVIFGIRFLRPVMHGVKPYRLYFWGISAIFVATLIGLTPSIKSVPFPMALIQILQLLSLYLFFASFFEWTTREIKLIIENSIPVSTMTETSVQQGLHT